MKRGWAFVQQQQQKKSKLDVIKMEMLFVVFHWIKKCFCLEKVFRVMRKSFFRHMCVFDVEIIRKITVQIFRKLLKIAPLPQDKNTLKLCWVINYNLWNFLFCLLNWLQLGASRQQLQSLGIRRRLERSKTKLSVVSLNSLKCLKKEVEPTKRWNVYGIDRGSVVGASWIR